MKKRIIMAGDEWEYYYLRHSGEMKYYSKMCNHETLLFKHPYMRELILEFSNGQVIFSKFISAIYKVLVI